MKLYGYWRSSSSYRVRIALNLKGLAYTQEPVHLVQNGGEQNAPAFRALNPAGRVPVLQLESGAVLSQSLAIIEYLDQIAPQPALLPDEPLLRARVRGFTGTIGDIQPLHNLSTLDALRDQFEADDPAVKAWVQAAIAGGLAGLEAEAETRAKDAAHPGPFLFAGAISAAEVCLVPQLYAARRFGVDVDTYPHLAAADAAARALEPVAAASPERQPDAPAS